MSIKIKFYKIKKISLTNFILIINFLTTFSIYQIYSNLNRRSSNNAEHTSDCNQLIANATPASSVVEIDGVKYPQITPLYLNASINFDCLNNKDSKPKLILAWNKRNGMDAFGFDLGTYEPFEKIKCPVVNCEFTNNLSRVNESDMILFSMWDEIGELPKWRQPHQHWVFVLIESPDATKTRYNFTEYDNLFNLSVTHRLNSNFSPAFYQPFKWSQKNNKDVNKNFMQNKTHFAAAIISHCGAESKRDEYIKELQKYINVDVYGKCGKPCPTPNDTWLSTECKKYLAKIYKFYFSFENTICKDYITEKFFHILQFDIIPVVYGANTHHMFIPKSGYINALGFQTPKHLAEYLLKVASDTHLYNSYFQWKKYAKSSYCGGVMCEICTKLNFGIKRSTIGKMDEFWNYKKECFKMNATSFKLEPYI